MYYNPEKSNLVRKTFNMTRGQEDFLEGLDDLSVSEHLRRAIDEYIARKRKELTKVSSSPSQLKGVNYGRTK